jgi:SAM-dependent methyltransferase
MADENCTPEYSDSNIDRTLLSSDAEQKLATSLTADLPEAIPYLPYLLQDLWELGSNPRDIIELLSEHAAVSSNTRILDLGCGKGAVSVLLADKFKCRVKGIDIFPEFIDYARKKAVEHDVSGLCEFAVDDINHALSSEKDYDIVILGALGDVLGEPDVTINKLKKTIKPSGFIIIDDGYVVEGSDSIYHSRKEWMLFFVKSGVMLVDEIPSDKEELAKINSCNQQHIISRANELKQLHPDKSDMFDKYVQSQQAECDKLEQEIIGVTWLLQSVS